MKKKVIISVISVVLVVALIAGSSVVFAAYGSQSDPLVTLSYLTDIFEDALLEKIDDLIATHRAELERRISGVSATFSVVSLSSGQVLQGDVGTEIMLRVGKAYCYASASPGLIDTTTGGTINGGSYLVTNHLYMVTIEGRGIKAENSVKVLVRGGYSIS